MPGTCSSLFLVLILVLVSILVMSFFGAVGGFAEGGGSMHVCHKCRWAFSNPHPSPKKRAAHKKQCGRINGYPTISSLESGGEGAVGSLGSGSIGSLTAMFHFHFGIYFLVFIGWVCLLCFYCGFGL